MSEEEKDNQDEGTEDQKEKDQTVTIEQFEEMKKIQSGLDRTITDLQKQLKQKDDEATSKEQEELNAKKTAEQKTADRIAAMEKELLLTKEEKTYVLNRSLASQLLTDAGIKVPRTLDRLVGVTEEETVGFVKAFIEDWEDDHAVSKDKEAKLKGRTVTKTDLSTFEGLSYTDMQALPDSKFKLIPEALVVKAMEAALKQE